MRLPKHLLVAVFPFVVSLPASAHLTYTNRDLGSFTSSTPRTATIVGQTTAAFGWADGTDADWAQQDRQRYFRFTLEETATLTITIAAADPTTLLPAFSLYSGLGHLTSPDHDGAPVTQAYLTSLGSPAREGAFDALHSWKIGNDEGTGPDDLTTLTYIGHAADGTSVNYGPATGINGDGVADGVVSQSFTLSAGNYTLAVGGAHYFEQSDTTARSFSTSVTNVPEPSSALLLAGGLAVLRAARLRGRSAA